MRRYQGPPGDDREYWLPRDRDALDAAWDAHYAERQCDAEIGEWRCMLLHAHDGPHATAWDTPTVPVF